MEREILHDPPLPLPNHHPLKKKGGGGGGGGGNPRNKTHTTKTQVLRLKTTFIFLVVQTFYSFLMFSQTSRSNEARERDGSGRFGEFQVAERGIAHLNG